MPIQAQATVQIDNEHFRDTEWRFQSGAETGWHRHEFDYVVVPLTTGQLKLQLADGESVNELATGQSYTRTAGSEHNVINPGTEEFVFVEIEAKNHSRD